MNLFQALKLIHVTSVVVSGALFSLRFALLMARPNRPLAGFLRVAPHVVDTVLLAAAIGMLAVVATDPLAVPWLVAKIIALAAYIACGALCLRSPAGSGRQVLFFVFASVVFAYIVLVALNKQVVPF